MTTINDVYAQQIQQVEGFMAFYQHASEKHWMTAEMQLWVTGFQQQIDVLNSTKDKHIAEFTKAFKMKDFAPTMEAGT